MNASETTASRGTIILIHGLWLTARSWKGWIERYQRAGYTVLAPNWPGLEGEVEAIRQDPSPLRGLKIKTVEALCHLRPVVVWPSGVDGLTPELRAMCQVASDWFDFACRVIELVRTHDGAQALVDRRCELAVRFAPDSVYAPLEAALARV